MREVFHQTAVCAGAITLPQVIATRVPDTQVDETRLAVLWRQLFGSAVADDGGRLWQVGESAFWHLMATAAKPEADEQGWRLIADSDGFYWGVRLRFTRTALRVRVTATVKGAWRAPPANVARGCPRLLGPGPDYVRRHTQGWVDGIAADYNNHVMWATSLFVRKNLVNDPRIFGVDVDPALLSEVIEDLRVAGFQNYLARRSARRRRGGPD